jgi:thymidylate kinase
MLIHWSLQPEVCFLLKIVNKEVGVSRYRKQESGPNLNRKYNPRRNSKKNQESHKQRKEHFNEAFRDSDSRFNSSIGRKEKKTKYKKMDYVGIAQNPMSSIVSSV